MLAYGIHGDENTSSESDDVDLKRLPVQILHHIVSVKTAIGQWLVSGL